MPQLAVAKHLDGIGDLIFAAPVKLGFIDAFETFTYENVAASFHNDTTGSKFNADAAKLAWDRTLAFLKQRLT